MNCTNKTKKYFIDSLKFVAFICFLEGIQGFWFYVFFAFPVPSKNEFILIIAIITTLYLRTIVHFFIAKRLGIIQFLNKKPLLISLITTYAIDCLVTYDSPAYDFVNQRWVFFTPSSVINLFFLTITFTSLYLIYKIAKGLSKKFSWIKKFYPKFLDKLSNTKSFF